MLQKLTFYLIQILEPVDKGYITVLYCIVAHVFFSWQGLHSHMNSSA